MRFGFIAGDTSKTIYVRLRDSTTGLAKTGLAYNSAGAIASYTLPLAARAAITLATQTVTGAWSSGGFVEVDATNCPGLYRFDLPNAAIASGAFTVISITFTGVIQESIEIELDTQKANVTQLLGTAWLTPGTAGTPDVNVKLWNGLTTVALPLVPTTAGRTLDVSAGGEAGIDWANVGSPTTTLGLTNTTVGIVTLVGTLTTYTGDTPQTGDAFARLGVAGVGLTNLGDTRIANLDATVSSRLATASYSAPPSAATNAAAVWDLSTTGHTTSGTFGEAMAAAGSAGDPWTTALPGSYTSGQAGKIVGDNLNATVGSRASPANVATELATYDGPTNAEMVARTLAAADYATASALAALTAYVDTEIAAILEDTGTTLPAQIAALNNLSASQVNAEVVDVLATDTAAELGAVPAANASLKAKITFLAMLARNKLTQTSTTSKMFADDGTTQVAAATVSDDGTTYTRGELA